MPSTTGRQNSSCVSPSFSLFIRLAPRHIALFRFLLESYDHLGYFTVLERRTALLRFSCPHDLKETALRTLEAIQADIDLTIEFPPWE